MTAKTRTLVGSPRPEYEGKLLLDQSSSSGYKNGKFLGVIVEAVESAGLIYCKFVYNDGECDYRYVEHQSTDAHIIHTR